MFKVFSSPISIVVCNGWNEVENKQRKTENQKSFMNEVPVPEEDKVPEAKRPASVL